MTKPKTYNGDPNSLPLKKAGAVIHGRSRKPKIMDNGHEVQVPDKHMLVAPYTQGRFFDEFAESLSPKNRHDRPEDLTKYYMLPKGSIDPGEDVLDAAIRETYEETHIDLRALLGEENIGKLKHGKPVEGWRSKGYPGVTVLRAEPVPFEHVYFSRASVPTRMAMFSVEVDGIERLRDHVKNLTNRDQPVEGKKTLPSVRRSVGELTANAMRHPPFATYLEWLRHGAIPPDQFTIDNPARDERHKRMHQLLSGAHAGDFVTEPPAQSQWFAQLEHDHAPDGQIASRADWQKFCRAIPDDDYAELRKAFTLIKNYAKGRGIIGADESLVKMDDKDSPLHYYQEGADIVSSERFVAHSLKMAELNEDYRHASSGDCKAIDKLASARLREPALAASNDDDRQALLRGMQIERSQLAGIAAFVPKRSLTRAVERFQGDMRQVYPELRYADTPGEHRVLEPLQQIREAQHRAWSERMQAPAAESGSKQR